MIKQSTLIVIALACAPPSIALADDVMARLAPNYLRAVISSDLGDISTVPAKPFASCLRSQGVTAADMRKSIKSGDHGAKAMPCLDKYVGL